MAILTAWNKNNVLENNNSLVSPISTEFLIWKTKQTLYKSVYQFYLKYTNSLFNSSKPKKYLLKLNLRLIVSITRYSHYIWYTKVVVFSTNKTSAGHSLYIDSELKTQWASKHFNGFVKKSNDVAAEQLQKFWSIVAESLFGLVFQPITVLFLFLKKTHRPDNLYIYFVLTITLCHFTTVVIETHWSQLKKPATCQKNN